jgi:hypothetical protein
MSAPLSGGCHARRAGRPVPGPLAAAQPHRKTPDLGDCGRVRPATLSTEHPMSIRTLRLAAVACAVIGTAGCFGGGALRQVNDELAHTDIDLPPGALEEHGIGFLTPSAATTREADKQALALAFAETLKRKRPDIRIVPMPAMLSAVNAADLDQAYKRIYRDYLQTGILDGNVLEKVGDAGGVRYLAQLNLANFEQTSRSRFSLLGLRFVETKLANMRVFLQVWDSQTGKIVWEGGGELNYTFETVVERPVYFLQVAQKAAERLYDYLPPPPAAPQP